MGGIIDRDARRPGADGKGPQQPPRWVGRARIQHGHVIEVTGKTELNARVMVNGHEVPIVSIDGTFHYFTPPLPTGESLITVTAQNAQRGVNTKQQKVVIQ